MHCPSNWLTSRGVGAFWWTRKHAKSDVREVLHEREEFASPVAAKFLNNFFEKCGKKKRKKFNFLRMHQHCWSINYTLKCLWCGPINIPFILGHFSSFHSSEDDALILLSTFMLFGISGRFGADTLDSLSLTLPFPARWKLLISLPYAWKRRQLSYE